MSYEGYNPYPKVLYHETEKPARVENEAEHKALGEGWYESPVDPAAEPAKAKRGRPVKAAKADEPATADETADAGAAGGE